MLDEIRDGWPAAEYHAHPALSSGGARILIAQCPAAYWWQSPFNPAHVEEERTEFDLGMAAHLAILEPARFGGEVVIIDADSYRTKDAQGQRDSARLMGRVPLLVKHYEAVVRVRDAVLRHPVAGPILTGGIAERSYVWTDPVCDVPRKARLDYLSQDGAILTDLKTVVSAHPDALSRRCFEGGWHQQAAWYGDAVEALTGVRPTEYMIVAVEREGAHLPTVMRMSDRALDWGATANAKALDLFRECRASGAWPGYPVGPIDLELPTWADYQLSERKERGGFQTREQIARALEAFAPEERSEQWAS